MDQDINALFAPKDINGCVAKTDIVTIGRGALAKPDLPVRFAAKAPLSAFDPGILGPIANIMDTELAA